MKTSSEQDVVVELPIPVEPDDTVTTPGEPLGGPLGGPDIFLSARTTGRMLFLVFPVPCAEGARRAKDARRAAARANHPCQSGGLHLVDLDGESETARIALRRRFEDTASTSTTPSTGASAAG